MTMLDQAHTAGPRGPTVSSPTLGFGVPYGDVLLPVLLPLVVTLLETVFWDELQAYTWLLYLPGVAVSAWLCGLNGGLFTLTCSIACAEGLLLALGESSVPPPESRAIAALLFSLLALVPVWLLQRFRSEREDLHEALAALRMRALLHTDAAGDDGSDLSLLRRLRTELLARELALAANPFPLALFGEDGRCIYASNDFADQLGLSFEAALALNLLGDDSFPVAGAPAAAGQLLQGRAGERSVLTVSDGRRRCQLQLLLNMPSPTIMLSLHQDGQLAYGGSQQLIWARPAIQPAGPVPVAEPALVPEPELALAPESALVPPPPPTVGLEGLRCLVVDDHQINRQLMSELLALEGVHVTLANNGLQAVSAVQGNRTGFDVVLMDLQMPGLDGYGAARQIRTFLSAAELPIFAVTADGAGVDRVRLLNSGIQDLLHKPIDHVALLQALHSLRPAGVRD